MGAFGARRDSAQAAAGIGYALQERGALVGLGRKAMEIDIVAESLDGGTLFVGEAKLALPKREAVHALRDLEAKASQLPFAGRYKRIVTRLFVAKDPPTGAVSVDWCEALV